VRSVDDLRRRLTGLYALVLLLAVWAVSCHPAREQAVLQNDQVRVVENNARTVDPAQARFVAAETVERTRLLSIPNAPVSETAFRGVALPLYPELPSMSYEEMLRSISALGASHVSIVLAWTQRTIFDNVLEHKLYETPSDDRVLEVLEYAHGLGLKVMVFPILHVTLRNPGEWRGRLKPSNPERWKSEYRRYILHYAALSAKADVELFSVGSELSSMEKYGDFWRDLIVDVRGVYTGKLLYSSNWDHFEGPTFWDSLDYIGVSAYFEVGRDNGDPVFVMANRWRKHRDELLEFARSRKRPLVLTEVGYPAVASAAVKPWDYTVKTDPDSNAQLAAFGALAQAWGSRSRSDDDQSFGGLIVWHGWGQGGETDRGYSIWDKPAETFIRNWFRGWAPETD
jgi:hypothetical protein